MPLRTLYCSAAGYGNTSRCWPFELVMEIRGGAGLASAARKFEPATGPRMKKKAQ
jgi:hypothetical protein